MINDNRHNKFASLNFFLYFVKILSIILFTKKKMFRYSIFY